jgi:hypothetical protein
MKLKVCLLSTAYRTNAHKIQRMWKAPENRICFFRNRLYTSAKGLEITKYQRINYRVGIVTLQIDGLSSKQTHKNKPNKFLFPFSVY